MARANKKQIKRVAEVLRNLPESEEDGLNFYSFKKDGKEVVLSDFYPRLNDPQTINFFFFICLHQYGFWHADADGYDRPMMGLLNGKRLKGSDLLEAVCKRALDNDPTIFEPARLVEMSYLDLYNDLFVDANGPIFFLASWERCLLTHNYAQWFIDHNLTPAKIIDKANKYNDPLRHFIGQTEKIEGYSKDWLHKKNLLLAMALANRPERFLKLTDLSEWTPIVDYHLMRVALRLGLVDLNDAEEEPNKNRKWVGAQTEDNIRSAVYVAILRLMNESGRSMPFIDEKLWMARRYCPEMEVPNCAKCIFLEVCARRVELFQPVFRTTNY